MNPIRPHRLLPLAWLATCGLAAAQGAPAPADPPARHADARHAAVDDMAVYAARELGSERIAKGAPYCADAIHETVQWLPDPAGGPANRIVRSTTTRLCRDGEGRTRQEVDRGGRTVVYLRDPVARESWVLDPQRRTARRLPGADGRWRGEHAFDRALWHEYGERVRAWARDVAQAVRDGQRTESAASAPDAPPRPVVIHRGGGDREVRVVRIDGDRSGPPPRPPLPPMPPLPALPPDGELPSGVPPAVGWRALSSAPRGPGVVTALPAKEIDGVRAHGERTTWTIEAGRIGNEQPIRIVREVWTSPELLLTVASRDFDPRRGELLYRLQNLRRGEPDPALMRVPADYTTGGRPQPAPAPGRGG